MNRVFITGDTHGGSVGDLDKLSSRKFIEGKFLTKNDYVIILGDFGLIWDVKKSGKSEQYWLDWLSDKSWTTLFLDGNHENHARLDNLPQEVMFGSVVGKVDDSIYHLKRGYVYTINNKTFFTFGGGFSIDKEYRKENISWWEREMPSFEEYIQGLDSLFQVDNKVDYILTHTCSSQEFQDLAMINYDLQLKIEGEEKLRNYFTGLLQKLEYKKHFYGHFHFDHNFGKHQVLHDKVIELDY